MNYKEVFKSRELRIRLLQFLDFVPDKLMIKIQYRIKLGRKLNLKNPQRYSEKLQWYKLYYRNPDMVRCCEKYNVRGFVEERGLRNILNTCYGVYDTPEDIKLDALPNSFVLKDTLGGGGNSVIIVQDKSKCNWDDLCKVMQSWVDIPATVKTPGREWVYENQKHRIIVEDNLLHDDLDDLPDFKFFCFNGEPFCMYMMQNYTRHHEEGILGFLTSDFKLLSAHRKDFAPMTTQPEKPENYDNMVKMARILSNGFPHVRVDFYNIRGKIVFGEMTFFNASGYVDFEPDEFDLELGKHFCLPQFKKKLNRIRRINKWQKFL